MDIIKQYRATEERLRNEADSMGDFLSGFRGRLPSKLIGDQGWEGTLKRAYELPATMAAFPFGFELPLHVSSPLADFGVSLIGGTQTAGYFEEKGEAESADASVARVAGLLRETKSEDSPLRRIVGRKMLFEYDVDSAPHGTSPDPGIFLYPDKKMLLGDGDSKRLKDLGVVVDAVASAAGWDLSAAERQQIKRIYMSLTPEISIWGIGAFPSRKKGIRLAAVGFRKTRDVLSFLDRIGWSGQHSAVNAIALDLEKRGAFVYMGVHMDIDEDGVGPKLGLSFYAQETEWLKDIQHWMPLIEGLREGGHVIPGKLSELVSWSVGPETLSGKSGQFMLMRGVHHIKATVVDDQVEQVKAYIFLLMFSWPFSF